MNTAANCAEEKSEVQTFFINPRRKRELHPENQVPANVKSLYTDTSLPGQEYALNTTAWD
ncbi:MAG: hypothetical protein IK104_08565 [Clostridia bacterium]|nr:hypothetical protein [Clostridia bacterium]